MSELLEGPDTGHPDNKKLIAREMEHESSYQITEAKTRDLSYQMAKDMGYRQHFKLAMITVVGFIVIAVATLIYIGIVEVDPQAAIIIGTILGAAAANAQTPLGWFFGSSMSSQNKSRIMEKELSEDG